MSRETPLQTATTKPTNMCDLGLAESLIVRAFRRWALGAQLNAPHHWSILRDAFIDQLGAKDGKVATASFFSLIMRIHDQARRPIRYHQPHCPCLGGDEAWLICFVGALQHGDYGCARWLAELLVGEDGIGGLLQAGGALAGILRAHSLAVPNHNGFDRPAGAAAITVH